ncbi:MAG: phytoene/squalene synthase family protein [Thermomicrobiales bacterium]
MRSETAGSVPDAMYLECEAIARNHGRTFYFASRCLPRRQQRAVLATYAYCRIADDIVDAAPERGAKECRQSLDDWAAQLETPTHPVALAFAESRERYGVPLTPVHDLITGMRMDLDIRRYQTWDELHTYCYRVAGTVGLMVAPILGCRNESALAQAADLGIAMQLTNILRDVGEDASIGRLYLPLDDIAAFGCDAEAILAGEHGAKFRELMQFQVARARALYAEAQLGIPSLDRYGRFTTLVASELYSRILDCIEALDYDVFRTRAHCTTRQKFLALPGISATFLRMSLFPPRPSTARLTVLPTTHPGEAIATKPISAIHADPFQPERRTYG